MEWTWNKAIKEELAKFATDEALQLFKVDKNIFDLNQEGQREHLVQAIYDNLINLNIQYAPEKHDDSGTHQRIRTPVEILSQSRQGTCLDLALLFCGLCLGCELLPKLIILEGHALAAVSLKLGRRDYKSNDEFQKNFLGKRERDSQGIERIQPDVFRDVESLKEQVEFYKDYCIIECTGFASSKSLKHNSETEPASFKRNEQGFLTFQQAQYIGFKQLNRLPFKYAIDIAVAHECWGIKPENISNLNLAKENLKAEFNVNVEKIKGGKAIGIDADTVKSERDIKANLNVVYAEDAQIIGGKFKEL
jgi:hypothetical protein